MLYNILFNLLNIVLNYLLIYPVGSVKLMGFTVKTIGLGAWRTRRGRSARAAVRSSRGF